MFNRNFNEKDLLEKLAKNKVTIRIWPSAANPHLSGKNIGNISFEFGVENNHHYLSFWPREFKEVIADYLQSGINTITKNLSSSAQTIGGLSITSMAHAVGLSAPATMGVVIANQALKTTTDLAAMKIDPCIQNSILSYEQDRDLAGSPPAYTICLYSLNISKMKKQFGLLNDGDSADENEYNFSANAWEVLKAGGIEKLLDNYIRNKIEIAEQSLYGSQVSIKAIPHSKLKESCNGGLYSSEMILSLLDKVQSPDALLVLVNLAKKYEIERYPLTKKLIDTNHAISEGIHKKHECLHQC